MGGKSLVRDVAVLKDDHAILSGTMDLHGLAGASADCSLTISHVSAVGQHEHANDGAAVCVPVKDGFVRGRVWIRGIRCRLLRVGDIYMTYLKVHSRTKFNASKRRKYLHRPQAKPGNLHEWRILGDITTQLANRRNVACICANLTNCRILKVISTHTLHSLQRQRLECLRDGDRANANDGVKNESFKRVYL